MVTGPILYFIWRRRYGGLTMKNPEAFPVNPKTGLAVGDTKRISLLFLFITVLNVITCVFVPWYEGWGTEDAWESGDYFDGIIENVNVDSIVNVIGTYLNVFTIVCAVLCIIFFLISRKVEKKG